MAGERVSEAIRNVDVVVVAARYDGPDGALKVAQAYIRRGAVWGDIVLLDRDTLLQYVARRRRVVTGRARSMPGDFEIGAALKIAPTDGTQVLVAEGKRSGRDDLGIPVF